MANSEKYKVILKKTSQKGIINIGCDNMIEKYLPIGSIVILKSATRKLMITGYLPVSTKEGKTEVYDYSGCLFPDGILNSDELGLFNHDQIEKILYNGFVNEESNEYLSNIKSIQKEELLKEIENDLKNNNADKDIERLDI